jgi:hypothetical protein
MVGSLPGCWPRAESGQANAVPPSADMNCRLPMPIVICPIKPLQCGEGYHDPIGRSGTDYMALARRKVWPLPQCTRPFMARNCLDGERSAQQLCGGKAAARSVRWRGRNRPKAGMRSGVALQLTCPSSW